ncbi:MAG: type II toxin-antitoxin system mRNA interferase toxin, RelE/StbE family [Candidatus Omnitrophica bacterium]|nr:type II toxin-antitoxin system mRNA interferase toxin, RelE/StbE family [Candidatus Omnitrophota bacterium]
MLIWKVKIHRLILSEDFKSITHSEQKRILKDIHKKLTIAPFEQGKPLIGELKGYWRLRIGNYRAIYKIKRDAVKILVVKVGIRRDNEVYKKLILRLKTF